MLWAKNKHGFTIVELLIVVVVIAILASITVVAYTGVQNRANDTAVKNDLANMARKVELYKVEKGAYPVTVYPGDSTNVLEETFAGLKINRGAYRIEPITSGSNTINLVYCSDSAGSTYGIAAWSKTSRDQGFMVRHNNGVQVFNQPLAGSTVVCPLLTGASSGYRWLWLYDFDSEGGWRSYI